MSLYSKRGVSAQKEEIHQAIRNLDQGLYPHAFCKLYPDFLGKNSQWVNVAHADGAGTKSILAYLYWKETGDISVWKGIAQDAVVMNLDDLLCVGIYNDLLFSSTIDRNKILISGEVIEQVIQGTAELFQSLKTYGIHIEYLGGETADVGDLVRTIAVNGTMTARQEKSRLITNEKIQAGNVIVGLASFGQSNYETSYNSGLASNGLTSARHDVLSKYYAENFPETYEPKLLDDVVYIGDKRLTDELELPAHGLNMKAPFKRSVGQLLLSPTRTFAPVMKEILERHFEDVYGLIHCSGGGQTKCLKYLPASFKIIKNNLPSVPPIFEMIQKSSGADDKEMYQVFNMGIRMEIYTSPSAADHLIRIAESYGVEAMVIGYVEKADKKALEIKTSRQIIHF
ncbi:MAG: phosphoribosylformylglycinamidine cyclo-ligase [Bacteroidetes bacterium]|nr:phosphoribosylformylglycinamidine cyclo-ligase [Bacteroidota bacterium]